MCQTFNVAKNFKNFRNVWPLVYLKIQQARSCRPGDRSTTGRPPQSACICWQVHVAFTARTVHRVLSVPSTPAARLRFPPTEVIAIDPSISVRASCGICTRAHYTQRLLHRLAARGVVGSRPKFLVHLIRSLTYVWSIKYRLFIKLKIYGEDNLRDYFLSLISSWLALLATVKTCANNRLIRLNKFVSRFTHRINYLFFISIRTPHGPAQSISDVTRTKI
jgi:hypothetical protein